MAIPDRARPRTGASIVAVAVLLALGLALAACGGGGDQPTTGLSDAGDLAGKTIGVAPVWGESVFETRYLLSAQYGLDVSPEGASTTFLESPADSLRALLIDGDVDAIIARDLVAFRLLDDEDVRVLSHVTQEMRDLTDAPILNSVLATYPDLAEQKRPAFIELNRMLAESLTYVSANQDSVLEAVAADQEVDQEFLRWWWERHDLKYGDLSADAERQLLAVWEAARVVGDIESIPELPDVLFDTEENALEAADGDRVTVSVAVLDDPGRRAALYAIEQGIITSDTVDINLSYLPVSALAEAAPARQYDVIETTPLAVLLGAGKPEMIILSIGLQDLDGTLIFVRTGS